MEVPKLMKISINQGIGEATLDKKIIDEAIKDLSLITGQKPVSIKAKSSVSNFKLSEGMVIGAKSLCEMPKCMSSLTDSFNVHFQG